MYSQCIVIDDDANDDDCDVNDGNDDDSASFFYAHAHGDYNNNSYLVETLWTKIGPHFGLCGPCGPNWSTRSLNVPHFVPHFVPHSELCTTCTTNCGTFQWF